MTEHPIDLYVAARDSLMEGDKGRAAEKLSQALGSEKPTEPIKGAIDKFLTKGTEAHNVALRLLESELKRREGDN